MGIPMLLAIGCLLLASLALPWFTAAAHRRLRKEHEMLAAQVGLLLAREQREGGNVPSQWQPPAPAQTAPRPASPPPSSSPHPKAVSHPVPHAAPPRREQPPAQHPRLSFEQQFGARLPVWIGGVALALAGFFLVKYSIESGLLSPAVRCVLGMLFGAGLLTAGHTLRSRKEVADGARIAQALTGAGIADLYVVLFAATGLYGLLPPLPGFVAMAGVTACAVVLSLRHGAPIALLGLVGGFLTPALVGSQEPNAPLLFLYLYLVLTGLFTVIRQRNWWWMSIPTVLAAFGWVVLWMLTASSPADGFWLGLFILAVSGTMVASSYGAPGKSGMLNYLTLGGAVILMGLIAAHSEFGLMQWALFGLLAAGGMALSAFDPQRYSFVPWLSMIVNAVMLAAWHGAEPGSFAITVSLFALLYTAGSYFLLRHTDRPVSWATFGATSALAYYILAWADLHVVYSSQALGVPLWGGIALGLAMVSVWAVREVMTQYRGPREIADKLLSIFALAATAFVALGLTVELEREFLSVAIAAEMLAVSWISTRVNIPSLRKITGALALVFAGLLLPQILLLVQLTAFSLLEARLPLQQGVPIVDWPAFQLGLPALMFAGASLLLRKGEDDRLVYCFELAGITLAGVMGYYLARHALHPGSDVLFVKAGFVERNLITNAIFAYGLACLGVGRAFGRRALSAAGLALGGIALFRVFWFDLMLYNPLWTSVDVGNTRILNGLLLPFFLPVLWLEAGKRLLAPHQQGFARYAGPAQLILSFALVTLMVRHWHHGRILARGIADNAEIYSYSAAWLLMGIGMLFAGTVKKDRLLRTASLGIMMLTVAKVFLYDASELEGLFRVFSFLGLGLSLLGLSWFYTRFVFNGRTISAGKED